MLAQVIGGSLVVPAEATAVIDAIRSSRAGIDQSVAAFSRLDPAAQVEVCLQLSPAERHELLTLVESPGAIVPLLPGAELARTLRGVGLEDAGWLLAHASPEQRVACVDLDCWHGSTFSRERFREWLDAMLEAGDETLLSALRALDLSVWVVAIRDMVAPSLGETDDSFTEDGLFHFTATDGRDEDRMRAFIRITMSQEPEVYLGLVAALLNESTVDSEELALRWRAGRMADAGFPDRDDAMLVYRPLAVAAVGPISRLVRRADGLGAILVAPSAAASLEAALRELPEERALELARGWIALSNMLAVADRLELADPDTGRRCLEKAIRGIGTGVAAITERTGEPAAAVLAAQTPVDLFRVGLSIDPELRWLGAEDADPLHRELLELFARP